MSSHYGAVNYPHYFLLVFASSRDTVEICADSTDNGPTPRGRNELDRKRSDRALAGTFPNAPPVAA